MGIVERVVDVLTSASFGFENQELNNIMDAVETGEIKQVVGSLLPPNIKGTSYLKLQAVAVGLKWGKQKLGVNGRIF